MLKLKNSQLVFVNGVLRKDLSSLADVPAGVVAMDLDEAIKDPTYQELIREHLARGVDYNTNGFVALNTAMIRPAALSSAFQRNVELEAAALICFSSRRDQATSHLSHEC